MVTLGGSCNVLINWEHVCAVCAAVPKTKPVKRLVMNERRIDEFSGREICRFI